MQFNTKADREKIVTLDWETYWSADFTLSSPDYSTSAYIRDPQFFAHCVAIKIGSKKTHIYRGKDMAKALKDIDWSTHAMLAQNTAFDAFISKTHYGVVPAYYLDTMSMTRGLHNEITRANLDAIAPFYGVGEKSKTYLTPTKGLKELSPVIRKGLEDGCVLDCDLCYAIAMKQLAVYPQDELDLIDHTIRMFCDSPLQVDLKQAKKALQAEMFEKRHLILNSGVEEDVLQSNPKLAKALQALGVEPPGKISVKTHAHSWSFSQSDSDFMDLLEHENKKVRALIAGRLAAKSTQMETRSNRLIQAGQTGGLPVGYNYYAAKTGRWGGTNKLNLQNLPRVDKDNPQPSDGLRRSIMAPEGHVLVVCDSAQIEARVNAWQAGQLDLLAMFANKEDPYCKMATDIYGRNITKADKDERFVGKVAVLGLGYNMGADKFKTTLELGTMGKPIFLDRSLCQKIVNLYRGRNLKIVQSWAEGQRVLREMGKKKEGGAFRDIVSFEPNTIYLPNGMPMHYPNLTQNENGNFSFKSFGKVKKVYGGLVVENLVQALSRIVIGVQMLEAIQELKAIKLKKGEVAKIVMCTHDELVACVPERFAKKVDAMMLSIMRTPPDWCKDIPLDAESGVAKFYSK